MDVWTFGKTFSIGAGTAVSPRVDKNHVFPTLGDQTTSNILQTVWAEEGGDKSWEMETVLRLNGARGIVFSEPQNLTVHKRVIYSNIKLWRFLAPCKVLWLHVQRSEGADLSVGLEGKHCWGKYHRCTEIGVKVIKVNGEFCVPVLKIQTAYFSFISPKVTVSHVIKRVQWVKVNLGLIWKEFHVRFLHWDPIHCNGSAGTINHEMSCPVEKTLKPMRYNRNTVIVKMSEISHGNSDD